MTIVKAIVSAMAHAIWTGYTFELQFHTPEGMALKMGESHHLYECVRSPQKSDSERVKLYLQLKSLWDRLPVRIHLPTKYPPVARKSGYDKCSSMALPSQVPVDVDRIGRSCRFQDRDMEALIQADEAQRLEPQR